MTPPDAHHAPARARDEIEAHISQLEDIKAYRLANGWGTMVEDLSLKHCRNELAALNAREKRASGPNDGPNCEGAGSHDVRDDRQSIAPEQTRSVPAPPSTPATEEVREQIANWFVDVGLVKAGDEPDALGWAEIFLTDNSSLIAPASAASFRPKDGADD